MIRGLYVLALGLCVGVILCQVGGWMLFGFEPDLPTTIMAFAFTAGGLTGWKLEQQERGRGC